MHLQLTDFWKSSFLIWSGVGCDRSLTEDKIEEGILFFLSLERRLVVLLGALLIGLRMWGKWGWFIDLRIILILDIECTINKVISYY